MPRFHLSSSTGVQRTAFNYLLACVQRIANPGTLLPTEGQRLSFLLWTWYTSATDMNVQTPVPLKSHDPDQPQLFAWLRGREQRMKGSEQWLAEDPGLSQELVKNQGTLYSIQCVTCCTCLCTSLTGAHLPVAGQSGLSCPMPHWRPPHSQRHI